MTGDAWQLLYDPPEHPAWNMAVDEALLETWRPGDPPLLRLYGWKPAALSLGRFQPAADVPCPTGAVLVRRITGGAAIHHREDEVTYSLVAPYRLFGGARPAYRTVHGLIAAALGELSIPVQGREEGPRAARARPSGLCFSCATAEDLVVGGKKLVGSAQRRRGAAFLQHGSIPLSPDPRASGSTSLAELTGRPLDREWVQCALANALRHTLGSGLVPIDLNEDQARIAEHLYETRYNAPVWTHER